MNFKLGLLCLLFGCAGPSQSISSVPAASTDEIETEGFRHAYLYGANFNGADLQGVDLYRCQLGQADLRNADLRNANLAGAYLFKADLRGADLRGARFSPTLKGAELKQTVLVGARFATGRISVDAGFGVSGNRRSIDAAPMLGVGTRL